jgi:hypothetical protein
MHHVLPAALAGDASGLAAACVVHDWAFDAKRPCLVR